MSKNNVFSHLDKDAKIIFFSHLDKDAKIIFFSHLDKDAKIIFFSHLDKDAKIIFFSHLDKDAKIIFLLGAQDIFNFAAKYIYRTLQTRDFLLENIRIIFNIKAFPR